MEPDYLAELIDAIDAFREAHSAREADASPENLRHEDRAYAVLLACTDSVKQATGR